ncbi:MAG: hypothetical protein ACRDEA_09010 [Microcystaceae cyanobacterium]
MTSFNPNQSSYEQSGSNTFSPIRAGTNIYYIPPQEETNIARTEVEIPNGVYIGNNASIGGGEPIHNISWDLANL